MKYQRKKKPSDLFFYHHLAPDHYANAAAAPAWVLYPDEPRHRVHSNMGLLTAFEGIASPDDARCASAALMAAMALRRCRRAMAVVLLVRYGRNVPLCGTHFAVHRSGKELRLRDR